MKICSVNNLNFGSEHKKEESRHVLPAALVGGSVTGLSVFGIGSSMKVKDALTMDDAKFKLKKGVELDTDLACNYNNLTGAREEYNKLINLFDNANEIDESKLFGSGLTRKTITDKIAANDQEIDRLRGSYMQKSQEIGAKHSLDGTFKEVWEKSVSELSEATQDETCKIYALTLENEGHNKSLKFADKVSKDGKVTKKALIKELTEGESATLAKDALVALKGKFSRIRSIPKALLWSLCAAIVFAFGALFFGGSKKSETPTQEAQAA